MLRRGHLVYLIATSVTLPFPTAAIAQEQEPANDGEPQTATPPEESQPGPAAVSPAPPEARPSGSYRAPSGPPPANSYVEPPDPTHRQRTTPTGAPRALHPAAPGTEEGGVVATNYANVVEPPIPSVYEPPPPPEPRHVAPRTAFWAGLRLGWFLPFGDIYARCQDRACYYVDSVPWRRYASPGPMLELDAGVRLGRNYVVFALWERSWLGAGDAPLHGQEGGPTDFWAAAVRFSSNPDGVGFLTEIAFGYRRARLDLGEGGELRLEDAPFEARLGVGADIRVNEMLSLSPLLTLGVGRFDEVTQVAPDGTRTDWLRDYDPIAHGSLTLQVGGHFDLFGTD